MASVFLFLTGCILVVGDPDGSSGQLTSQERLVGAFDRVTNASRVDVTVNQGASVAVTASCREDLLDQLYTDANNGELVIDNSLLAIGDWSDCSVNVTTPRLTAITHRSTADTAAFGDWPELGQATNEGVGALEVQGNLGGLDLVELTDNGDVFVGGLDVAAVLLMNSGAGALTATGKADLVEGLATSLGGIDALDLIAPNADLTNASSSDLSATVTDYAVVTLTGSGDVRIAGGADVEIRDSGTGSVIVY
jgi:Putative auto-transporter adhesin, head GIN domain